MATNEVPFDLSQFGSDLMTRDQGARVRDVLQRELAALKPAQRLEVSFEGVQALTPSFVDESLGRLLLAIGVDEFRRRFHLRTSDETTRRLVNHVLAQRAAEPTSHK